MPQGNTHGGKGYKKRKRKDRNKAGIFNPEDGDYYTVVTRKLCDNRIVVKCDPVSIKGETLSERQVIIPGRMKRRVWINEGDYVCCRSDEILWRIENDNPQELARAKKYCTDHYNKDAAGAEDYFGNDEQMETKDQTTKSKSKMGDDELDIDAI
jgi:initiation factor 1A